MLFKIKDTCTFGHKSKVGSRPEVGPDKLDHDPPLFILKSKKIPVRLFICSFRIVDI